MFYFSLDVLVCHRRKGKEKRMQARSVSVMKLIASVATYAIYLVYEKRAMSVVEHLANCHRTCDQRTAAFAAEKAVETVILDKNARREGKPFQNNWRKHCLICSQLELFEERKASDQKNPMQHVFKQLTVTERARRINIIITLSNSGCFALSHCKGPCTYRKYS